MVVKISLQDLDTANVGPAFDPKSLGLLLVDGLGPRYAELRRAVLESARELANLPAAQLRELEVPEALYLTGWSHGQEKLEGGQPDLHKGSFYVNCNFTRTGLDHPDLETMQRFPSPQNSHANVWPAIEHFESDLKELVSFMTSVAVRVAAACDRCLDLPLVKPLASVLRDSDVSRARLLHYYQSDTPGGEWCGNHRDHSCLTVLTSALWGPQDASSASATATSTATSTGTGTGTSSGTSTPPGLYIETGLGSSVKLDIPEDCLAIQSGSALEIMSSRRFRAVPHRVVGDSTRHRSTLAVFCQPRLEDQVGDTTFAAYGERIVLQNLASSST